MRTVLKEYVPDGDRSDPENGQPHPVETMRRLWRDSIVVVAVATAFLYLLGSLYLDAKFGKLGLAESEIQFDFHHVMKASVLPLMFPVFLIVLFSAFCHGYSSPEHRRAHVFFPPIPMQEPLAVILTVWVIKLFADFLHPISPERWWLYRQRDAALFFLGAVALLILYVKHRRAMRRGPSRFSPETAAIAAVLVFPTALLATAAALKGHWDLNWRDTSIIAIGYAYLAFLAWKDLRDLRKRQPKPRRKPLGRLEKSVRKFLLTFVAPLLPLDDEGRAQARRIIFVMLAMVAALLAASLGGSVAGTRLMTGCEAYDTVKFWTPPKPVIENHTYWLILHQEGLYYLREPPTVGSNVTIIDHASVSSASRGKGEGVAVC